MTTTIDEDGTSNAISIDRISNAPVKIKYTYRAEISVKPKLDLTKNLIPSTIHGNDKQTDEYVGERIVGQICK